MSEGDEEWEDEKDSMAEENMDEEEQDEKGKTEFRLN
jgi:hypothetical protein